ncbi:hypothetical protein BGX38DRAFT_1328654 [Terfezia claveryi]|nr:hypothetical protein BGX38DRAFT_1328654 [Terfezia claveryi]
MAAIARELTLRRPWGQGDRGGKSPGVELAAHGRRGVMKVTSVGVDYQGARTRKDYGGPLLEVDVRATTATGRQGRDKYWCSTSGRLGTRRDHGGLLLEVDIRATTATGRQGWDKY